MWASIVVGIISALVAGGTAVAQGVQNKRARSEAEGNAAKEQQLYDLNTAQGRQLAQRKAQVDALSLENEKKMHSENMLKSSDELSNTVSTARKMRAEGANQATGTADLKGYNDTIAMNRSIRNLMR